LDFAAGLRPAVRFYKVQFFGGDTPLR
jgi:hypothetical protein